MKYALAIAAVLVAACGTTYAEDGNVGQDALSAMGLPGIAVMNDVDGMNIRGQGFAAVSSVSASRLPGTHTKNYADAVGYNAANAETGAASQIEGDILISNSHGVKFSLQFKAAVGSAGYAYASSN